jgi:hypothetical protein
MKNGALFRPRSQSVKAIKIKTSERGLTDLGKDAKLEVIVTTTFGDTMELRASGLNCTYLKEVMKNFFPKMTEK